LLSYILQKTPPLRKLYIFQVIISQRRGSIPISFPPQKVASLLFFYDSTKLERASLGGAYNGIT